MVSKKIIICVLAILVNIGFAGAATLNVGPGETHTTIQSAIDAANPGDTVSVGEGVYVENVRIKKNDITLIGKNREKTVIDGKKTSSGIRIDESNNIKISGFTIRNSGGSGTEDGGVTLYKSGDNTVTNLIITGNTAGISIYMGSNNNIISGNDVISNQGKEAKGIFIYGSDNNKIFNNNIQGNPFGLYSDSGGLNQIYSNNFIDNKVQAYERSAKNAWDDGKNGNFWNEFTGSGAYKISGGTAQDNYPRSGAVIIKVEIPTSTTVEQKTDAKDTSPKSSPGFSGFMAVAILIIGIGVSGYWKKN